VRPPVKMSVICYRTSLFVGKYNKTTINVEDEISEWNVQSLE